MRCLIADDVSILRRIIENILNPFFEVILVNNGQEALKKFEESLKKKQPFDVVFLDIMMPKLNGIQTLEKMRQIELIYEVQKKAKIIMVTILSDQDSVEEALEKGCDGYILKPYSPYNVLKALKRYGINIKKLKPVPKNKQPQNKTEEDMADSQKTADPGEIANKDSVQQNGESHKKPQVKTISGSGGSKDTDK